MLSCFKGFFPIRRYALVVGTKLFWQVCFGEQYGREAPKHRACWCSQLEMSGLLETPDSVPDDSGFWDSFKRVLSKCFPS